jgi:hypothetical protein
LTGNLTRIQRQQVRLDSRDCPGGSRKRLGEKRLENVHVDVCTSGGRSDEFLHLIFTGNAAAF